MLLAAVNHFLANCYCFGHLPFGSTFKMAAMADRYVVVLRWRVSKLVFARAENKLFLVWRSEESDGCQLPYKLMGYMKGAGLLSFVLRRALREREQVRGSCQTGDALCWPN